MTSQAAPMILILLALTAILVTSLALIYLYVKSISIGLQLMFDDSYVFKASDIFNLKK